jgi:hypothetical protein
VVEVNLDLALVFGVKGKHSLEIGRSHITVAFGVGMVYGSIDKGLDRRLQRLSWSDGIYSVNW